MKVKNSSRLLQNGNREIFICLSLLFCCVACGLSHKPTAIESNQSRNLAEVSKSNPPSQTEPDTVNAKRFICNEFSLNLQGIASDLKCEVVEGYDLQNGTDKPDSTSSQHLQIKLTGYDPKAKHSSSKQPEIAVFRMSELREALAKSQEYVGALDDDVSTLKRIIADTESWKGKELPHIPWVDANQDSHTHQKRLDFLNGSGVVFLVQFNLEPLLINNEGLEYDFQGIANDGDTFVTASFPVRNAMLPENYEVMTIPGYTIPEDFYGSKYDENKRAYQKYLNGINGKLSKMGSAQFEPNLVRIEAVLKSIKIGQ